MKKTGNYRRGPLNNLKAQATPPPGNSTTNAVEQQKGREFRWVSNEINYRSTNRGPKDILSYKEALVAAESVYWPNRHLLYDLYKDIELDGFLVGLREKIIDTILNKTLLYKAGDTVVEDMNKLINSQQFQDMCRELLLTKFWGITGVEFIPGDTFRWNEIDRKHIKPKWRKITWDQYGNDGISYDNFWNLWVVGKDKDLGMYLICAFYVLLKKGVISNWADFIEMYGLPTTVMKYEAYDEQTKAELKKIIKEAGSALQIVIPKQADHEIHGDKNTSNGDVQNKFRMMANEEMAVLIAGNTETSTSSSKSGGKSQAKTHSDQQKEKIKSLMKYLANLLNEPIFINVLRNYGYPVREGGSFIFDKEVDIEYMKEKYEIDRTWVEQGLDVSQEYVYRTYAIDKPGPGETLLQPRRKKKAAKPGKEPDQEDELEDLTSNSDLVKLRRLIADRSNPKQISLKALYKAAISFFVHAR